MNWLTGFTIFMLVFGALFGIVMAGLNPWTDPAEAQLLYTQVEHQSNVDRLEEEKLAAQTQAEIAQIEAEKQAEVQRIAAEQAYQQGLRERDLRAYEIRLLIFNGLLGLGGLALIVTVASFALVRLRPQPITVSAKPVAAQTAPKAKIQQNERSQHRSMEEELSRINAEQCRLFAHYIQLHQRNRLHSPGLGKEAYQKLPLAGD